MRSFACLLLFASQAGCDAASAPATDGGAPDAGDPLSWAVDQPGPFAVGFHVVKTTYTPPGGLPPRTIPVSFWYPTNNPAGEHPSYSFLNADESAWTDAPPAPAAYAGGFPVLVHSHGYKGWAGANYHVADYLASHGWVVIEPEHTGNTFTDTPATLPLAIYLWRPLDVRAALDLAANLPAGDPLANRIDLKRVAMTGHSFGTYTAWAVAGTRFDLDAIKADCAKAGVSDCSDALINAFAGDLSEPRAQVIAPLAGGPSGYFGANPYDPRKIPVLSAFGSLNDGGETTLYDAQVGIDWTLMRVDGGCHELFNLGNSAAGNLGNNSGTSCSALPDTEGFAIVDTMLLSWLRYHVLGDRGQRVSGIVAGTVAVSPRLTLKHK